MWMPTLINYTKENDPNNSENNYYRKIFKKYYPNFENIIIERIIPKWS